MKVLSVHNKYKIRGGEDESKEAKIHLLTQKGHTVRELVFDNAQINSANSVLTGLRTVWSNAGYDRLKSQISEWRPDVVDVDNFFPLASPSIYYAAHQCRVPIIQTLHNYRMVCPASTLFREGRVCEECLGKLLPWPGIVHRCYRESAAASSAVATMIGVHNLLSTWRRRVTLFLALTEFSKRIFISAGFPEEQISLRRIFVPVDLGLARGAGDYFLYVGRLSGEKGTDLLLDAWRIVRNALPSARLTILGDGPLAAQVNAEANANEGITYLGRRLPAREDVYQLMGDARALLFPSQWYEGMPAVILESFSRGTPVIATAMGAMAEMIRDGQNGWLVEPGNPAALADRICRVASLNDTSPFRCAARREYLEKYTVDAGYKALMQAYEQAIALAKPASP